MKTINLVLICFLFLIVFVRAEEPISDWKFNGQFQLRSDVDGRDFNHKTPFRIYTSMRTRASIEKWISNDAGFFVQFQDSRVFGEEGNTITSLANVDIHQAYVKFNLPFGLPFSLQAGRFEMLYGTERIFGPLGWHYVGRSFDGARLSYKGFANIDVFGLTIANEQQYIPFASPDRYQPTQSNKSFSIYGLWLERNINEKDKISLFAFYEINDKRDDKDNKLLERINLGLNSKLHFDKLTTLTEFMLQSGKSGAKDIFAYMLSLSADYDIKPVNFGAGIDILSGTDPSDTIDKFNTFSQDYGTNHKFYGYMDYFINIPLNTNNLGLMDIYLMLGYKPVDSKFSGSIHYHYFMSHKKSETGNKNFGQEIDITLNYAVAKGLNLVWGGSVFLADALMEEKFRTTLNNGKADPALWTYLMIQANLN